MAINVFWEENLGRPALVAYAITRCGSSSFLPYDCWADVVACGTEAPSLIEPPLQQTQFGCDRCRFPPAMVARGLEQLPPSFDLHVPRARLGCLKTIVLQRDAA
jgi:hypothetical protein